MMSIAKNMTLCLGHCIVIVHVLVLSLDVLV